MPTQIRFHLDESMPNDVASGLRKRSRDCTTSSSAGLIGATDEAQLAFATAESRTLVTRDTDFLTLAADGRGHAGIVYWTEKNHFGQLIKDLDALCLDYNAEEVQGAILYY